MVTWRFVLSCGFPEDTSESQMCRVSNGWISVDQTDPVEELW